MTLLEAKNYLSEKSRTIYNEREAKVVTDWLLEDITGWTKTERLINKTKELIPSQEQTLRKYCEELLRHRPVQYILGYADFMRMKFVVNESVLIPRPETEELINWILETIKNKKHLKILDIGTGSGIIPVALKKYAEHTDLTAVDISEEALSIAGQNAKANNVEIDFFRADILQQQERNSLSFFDIIVSNPPYVRLLEKAEMENSVLQFEPHQALFVPDDDALLFYKTIVEFATDHLNNDGFLFFEINENFGKEVVQLLQEYHFQSVELKRDFLGKDRMVKALFKK